MYTNSWYYSVKALACSNIVSLPVDTETILSMVRQKGYTIIPFHSYRDACMQKLASRGIKIPSNIAFTVSIPNFKTVYYNNTLPSNEILFALAHEYGHICLSPSAFCGILGKSDNPEQDSLQEQEADAFALNLLAPPCVLSKLNLRTIAELQKLTLLNSSRAYSVYSNLKKSYISSADDDLVCRNFARFIHKYRLKKYQKGVFIAVCLLLICVIVYFSGTAPAKEQSSPLGGVDLSRYAFSYIEMPTALISPTPTSADVLSQENEYVVVTQSGERYHTADCFHIKYSVHIRELVVADAESLGFTPCKDCMVK